LKRQRAEKEAIALAVLDLIGDGETLMIDGGTTTAEVCGLLGARRNLTVVSSALNPALPALVTDCGVEVFLTGGYLLPQSQALVGDAAEASLRGIHAGKAILGMDGVSLEHGLTTQKFLEARMKRLMIESCDSVIIVADHTKLGRIGMIHVAPLTAADTLVTDELAPSELLEQLEMRGIRVVIARVGAAEPDQ
jgi:DeoR family fructose operon transcriptional repressor